MFSRKLQLAAAVTVFLCAALQAQVVTDPLPYAPIANPLPDTMDQLYRDSVNLKFNPIRINQAGYRPQDRKFFYYVGSASAFTVIDKDGKTVGNGTLKSTGQTCSGQLKIKASNNAQLVNNGDTRYTMQSPAYSGAIAEGELPDLMPGAYRIVVGKDTSAAFVIDQRIYSWIRDALLKFYGVNRCGDTHSWFHPPCHLKDPVTGGWHDCGDHLKEGATMSYTAAVLGLAAAAFEDRDADVYSADQGVTQVTDGIPDILYEAKIGSDFVLQSYDLAGGKVAGMITSVGDFGMDHMWWGRPENQDKMPPNRGGPPREGRVEVTTDYLGKYIANVAFVSKRIRPYDAAYADRCLKAAKDMYEFTKSRRDHTDTPAYSGSTIVSDDAALGCLALLWATGDKKYLSDLCYDKTIGTKATVGNPKLFEGGWFTYNDPLFSHTMANTDWASVQAHVLWGFFKLILSDPAMCQQLQITQTQHDTLLERTVFNMIANLSSAGAGTQTIQLPDNGIWVQPIIKYGSPWFTMFTQMEWVYNRYQAGNITEMYYYWDMASKIQGTALPSTPATADWKADEVKKILIRMMDYMLGVNPWDISMIYGVGAKNFNHPHLRAANPEGKNVPGAFYRYFPPVGALQGGYQPTTSLYDEFWADYMHSETGIDGTTNILMPVVGLAKEDTIGAPSGTVRIIYVGCEDAIIEVRQSRYGDATVRYGTGPAPDKVQKSDSTGVLHRIVLTGLTKGTVYNFDVLINDMFGRDSVLKYLDEDKNLVNFTFTTKQTCPTNADIANVKVCKVTSDSAEIFWYTPNGEFDSRVVYGEQKPPTTVQDGDISGHPVKFHYVKIGGLKEKTTYYFYVESGDSRDDNNGQLYQFTTPVEFVKFDVRMLRYNWGDLPGLGCNIVNQDSKSYDSLEVRIYFRAPDGLENDIGARLDICVLYQEDGFQDQIAGALRTQIWNNLAKQKPQKIPDTFDPTDNTYAYYFALPLWGVEMRSQSRIRLDIFFVRWEQDRGEDQLNEPPLHQITNKDWSFGPHSKANGDPVDFPGVPTMDKDDVDNDYWNIPINQYVTIYRKNEYIWGYSPSKAELQTKKTQFQLSTQVTSPLSNPSADYILIDSPNRKVTVSGWAKIEPVDGMINDIWINGVRLDNPEAYVTPTEVDGQYNFTVQVPVQNGRNNVDITLFAGPSIECDECYGCAVSNHSFFIESQGAKQYPSTLVLRDLLDQPVSDTVHPDTTQFNIIVTDRNGNINGKATDNVIVKIKNLDNGDSTQVFLVETGDSTGIFKTTSPIAVVDRLPAETGERQIAMNGGDRVRIWYVDPTDETDSSEAFIYSKANFPLARRGYLKDQNGDGMVDLMVVEYSIALKANPDSVRLFYPTSTQSYMFPAAAGGMTFTGSVLQIQSQQPFPDGVTGFTSALYSTAVSYLTSSDMVRSSEFKVYDSIGPVLNGSVTACEREVVGLDTITLTLSEGFQVASLPGPNLLLRKGGADFPVEVVAVLDLVSGMNTVTLLVDAKGQSFAAGDSLWLNSASAFTDMSGNKPHVNNRRVPVLIKVALPSVTQSFYQDTDRDGRIDKVVIQYNKPIPPEQTAVLLKWGTGTMLLSGGGTVTATGAAELTVILPPVFTGDTVVTGGTMTSATVFATNPADTIMSDVADSAAPVIASGLFRLTSGISALTGRYHDTLDLTFSESVRNTDNLTSLLLYSSVTNQPYTFTVIENLGTNMAVVRLVGVVDGVEFPSNGDLVWLPPNSLVGDYRGNSQISAENRHAPVKVADVHLSLKDVKITKAPNPFLPTAGEVFKVMIEPISRFPMQLDSSAQAVIYDKVGNVVTRPVVAKNSKGVELDWDGTNKKGRLVGCGTYLMILSFKGEQQKIMVGVVNRK